MDLAEDLNNSFFPQQPHLLSLQKFKEDKNDYKLAVFNGQKLIFSLYNKNLIVVDTQMTKVEIFFKKGINYNKFEAFTESQTPIAVNLIHHKGMLISHNITEVNVLDFQKMEII